MLWARHEVDITGVEPIESESRLAANSGILSNRTKHTTEAVGCVTWQGRKKRPGDAPDVAVGDYVSVRPAKVVKKRKARKKKTGTVAVDTEGDSVVESTGDAAGLDGQEELQVSTCLSVCLFVCLLSIYLSIYLSIFGQSVSQSLFLSMSVCEHAY